MAGEESLRPAGDTPVPTQLGDYQLICLLGRGGMGAVYKAVHQRLGKTVAIKTLKGSLRGNAFQQQRFEREIQAAGRLSHPHIVTALDAREDNGISYLVTEYVAGLDLDRLVQRDGPFPVAIANDCIRQAAVGLAYAHQQGVIHRDIKPGNLLLGENGILKILDLGLARLCHPDDNEAESLTQTGIAMGTPSYMAPEQARNSKHADERSDVYSLGCTYHWLLFGQPLYQAESGLETIIQHLNEPLPSLARRLPGLPLAFDQFFERLVAKHPRDRFASMQELIDALDGLPPVSTELVYSATAEPSATNPTVLEQFNTPGTDDELSAVTAESAQLVTESGSLTVESRPLSADSAGQARRHRAHKHPLLGRFASSLRWAILGVLILGSLIWWRVATSSDTDQSNLVGAPNETQASRNSPQTRTLAELRRSGLRFDGQSAYVHFQGIARDSTEPLTVEILAERRGEEVSNLLTMLGDQMLAVFQGGTGRWGLAQRNGNESWLIESEAEVPYNRVVHLVGVVHNNRLSLFLDGAEVATQPVDFTLYPTDSGVFIGGADPARLPRGQNRRFFNGTIYAVRITQGILPPQEFLPNGPPANDSRVLLEVAFSEGYGNTVRDRSSYERVGTITNARWVTDR